jgi:hypothetical protein
MIDFPLMKNKPGEVPRLAVERSTIEAHASRVLFVLSV